MEQETHSHKHHGLKHHSHEHAKEGAEGGESQKHHHHHKHHHKVKQESEGEEAHHEEHHRSNTKKEAESTGAEEKPHYTGKEEKPHYGRGGGSLTFNYNSKKDYTHEETHAVMKEDVDDMYGFEENNDTGWSVKDKDEGAWGAAPVDEEYLERAHEGHHVNAHSRGFKESRADGLPSGVAVVDHGTDDRGRKIHYDVGIGDGAYGVIEDDAYAGQRGRLVQGHRQLTKKDEDGYISVDRGLKDDDFEPGVRSERAVGCMFLIMAPFELLYLFLILTPYVSTHFTIVMTIRVLIAY